MIDPGNNSASTAAVKSRACKASLSAVTSPKTVNLVERADPVGRGAAPGDQDRVFGGDSLARRDFEVGRQTTWKLGPVEQAAADLDDGQWRAGHS